MSIDFTVAIRTYNGAKRLPEVLEHLQQQTETEGIRWEVIVVDNNSKDETAAVVAEYTKHWRQDSQLRYILETKSGSSYARDRCVWEANSELIGFLDDDNLPAPTWVAEAYRFGKDNPKVGAYGSNIYPMLDDPEPADFEQIKHFLAVSDRGKVAFRYLRTTPRLVPYGAGCVIRKQAWLECVPECRRLRGRDESWKVMIGGAEDIEVMYSIHNSDWELWHNPGMEIWHHLSPRRLEREYLLKIARASGLSVHACWLAQLPPWQRPWAPFMTPVYIAVRAYRVAMYYLRHQRDFAKERAKACQFEFMLGRLLSPFFTPPPRPYYNTRRSTSPEHRLSTQSLKRIA